MGISCIGVDKSIAKETADGIKYKSSFLLDSEADGTEFKKNYCDYPAGTTGLIATTGDVLILKSDEKYGLLGQE